MESDRPVILSARNLGKRLALGDDQLSILTGIDLEIKAGESIALVGASGSGKTTLLGLLAGLDTPTEGTVHFAGQPFSAESEDRRAALRAEGIAFVFQNFQLLGALTALENVMIPLELAGRAAPEALACSYLERVGLGDRARHTPRQLSGGAAAGSSCSSLRRPAQASLRTSPRAIWIRPRGSASPICSLS